MPDNGTPGSFSEFYRAEFSKVVAFMVMSGAGDADARDAAQEAFVAALRCWKTIASPGAWVRKTAWRAHLKRQLRVAGEVERAARADWAPRPDFDRLDIPEEEKRVLRLIAKLPPRQRQVMAWHFDGYSDDEIARFTGLRNDAVAASRYQARQKLKQWWGEDDEEHSGGQR